jgi:hypothetical protein
MSVSCIKVGDVVKYLNRDKLSPFMSSDVTYLASFNNTGIVIKIHTRDKVNYCDVCDGFPVDDLFEGYHGHMEVFDTPGKKWCDQPTGYLYDVMFGDRAFDFSDEELVKL